jgi:hypothetical protein
MSGGAMHALCAIVGLHSMSGGAMHAVCAIVALHTMSAVFQL